MGVHPACLLIDRAGKVATPERNLAENHSSYLVHSAYYRAPTGGRQEIISGSSRLLLLATELQAVLQPIAGSQPYSRCTLRTLAIIAGQYMVTSIWLLGPDGKVIARDLRGAAIKETVERALRSR